MNDVAIRASVEAEITGFEMKPRSLDEAMKFAQIMSDSDLVPSSYKGKPGNVLVAIQLGSELGLSPMRSLRSIAVINGRGTLWGDDLLAMVLASPVCEYVNEGESTDTKGVCKTKRKGCVEQVSTFTLEDAKRAGLLGKQGPWQTNTSRMLKLRARGFGLRDTFADVLAGLVSAEEALDLPPVDAESGAATILEASQPLTLKDKLRAKVEHTDQAGAAPVIDEASRPAPTDASDLVAPAPIDDPAEIYRGKLRTCERSSQAVNATYNAIPEEIRQDCFACYTDQLKSLGKKK